MQTDLGFLKTLLEVPSETQDLAQCNRASALMREYLEARGIHCAADARHFGRSKAPIAVLGIDGDDCHTPTPSGAASRASARWRR